VRLLREPEDRKDRIGGTRTAVDGDDSVLLLEVRGGRYETGGRWEADARLSSELVLDSVLGKINSRWPDGDCCGELSVEECQVD
jgi:hypothetical protein